MHMHGDDICWSIIIIFSFMNVFTFSESMTVYNYSFPQNIILILCNYKDFASCVMMQSLYHAQLLCVQRNTYIRTYIAC